jgi:putative FmdB family regulatory protein
MPLYTYECSTCDVVLEELVTLDRAPLLVECPICHGLCRRAVTAAAMARREAPVPAPVYGRVPAAFHGETCSCCAPRRRT